MIDIYKSGELSKNIIYDLLKKNDSQFNPLLSSRLDLKHYSIKLSKNSTIITYTKLGKLMGFIAFYNNNHSLDFAYISLICVLQEFQGKGIGTTLLRECISFLKKGGIKAIKLEVDIQNISGLKFYNKFGFDIDEKKHQSLILHKSL